MKRAIESALNEVRMKKLVLVALSMTFALSASAHYNQTKDGKCKLGDRVCGKYCCIGQLNTGNTNLTVPKNEVTSPIVNGSVPAKRKNGL
jgi:hypothetical protein